MYRIALALCLWAVLFGCTRPSEPPASKSAELSTGAESKGIGEQQARAIAAQYVNTFLADRRYTGADGKQYPYPTNFIPDNWTEAKKTKGGWELRIRSQIKGVDIHLKMDDLGQNIKVVSYGWSTN